MNNKKSKDMYKKIILIGSFVCLCFSFQLVAQSVKTNLYVTFTPCDSIHFEICWGTHIADVTQEFVLEKHITDTLFLTLDKHYSFWQSLFPLHFHQKLTVEIISKNKKQSLKPDFDGTTLRIPLPSSSCTVKLNYFYSTDYSVRSSNTNSPSYVWSCNQHHHSWYFNYPDMQFDKVEFTNPYDSLLYLFVDAPSSKQNEKIILETKNMNKEYINFYLFEMPFFHKTTCIQHTDTINIYLDKGAIIIPNSKGSFRNGITLPGNRATQALEDSCKNLITHALKKLNAIFPPLQGRKIDIFDADLTMNDAVTWGTNASDKKSNHHMILIDTSYWQEHDLIHELIHLYSKNPLSQYDDDSTIYFFGESITEYLAVCIRYEDKQTRDLVFNKKIILFAKEPNEHYSIFKLSSNSADLNTARGSYLVVYHKTPFIIHTFAQMVGEEKFHAALKQFYAKVAKGMTINLSNFEQIVKENGVTDKQWNWFIRNL